MIRSERLRAGLCALFAAEDDDILEQAFLQLIGHRELPLDMYLDHASNWLRITTSEVPLFE